MQAGDGRVRLVGISTFEQKDRAMEIASAVQGVSGVDDGITLRSARGWPRPIRPSQNHGKGTFVLSQSI